MSRLRPAIGPGHDRGVTASLENVDTLLQFPTVHPYKKWWGTHWRLVELADLSISVPAERVQPGIDQEVAWLTSTGDSCTVDGAGHAAMRRWRAMRCTPSPGSASRRIRPPVVWSKP
jgi:hypothetical protein